MVRRIVVIASLAVAAAFFAAGNVAQAAQPGTTFLLPPSHGNVPKLGIYGRILPDRGMLVTGVVRGSEARRIGLEPGDTILSINQRRIHCEHDYFDALRHSGGVLYLRVLDVRSGGVIGVRAYLPHDHDHVHIYNR
jgi:S1-C subfamily serine protease